MKNKTKGVIAGLAGLALLSGGATFALWTDTRQPRRRHHHER